MIVNVFWITCLIIRCLKLLINSQAIRHGSLRVKHSLEESTRFQTVADNRRLLAIWSHNVCFCSNICLYNLHLFYPQASNSDNIFFFFTALLPFSRITLCMYCTTRLVSYTIIDFTSVIFLNYNYNTILGPADYMALGTTCLVLIKMNLHIIRCEANKD